MGAERLRFLLKTKLLNKQAIFYFEVNLLSVSVNSLKKQFACNIKMLTANELLNLL